MMRNILSFFLITMVTMVVMTSMTAEAKQTVCESDKLNIRCVKQNNAANNLIVKSKVGQKGMFKVIINKYSCSKEAETKEKVSVYNKAVTAKKPAEVKFQAAGGLDDCAEAIIHNCTINRVEKQCDTVYEVTIDPANS